MLRAKRDPHVNKSKSLYQIAVLWFLIHKRDLLIKYVKNKLSTSFLIKNNINIPPLHC